MLTLAAVIGVLGLGVVLAALLLKGKDDAAVPPSPLASVTQLAKRPAAYFRKPMIVTGEVSEVLGPRAVILGGEEFEGGDSLLMISDDPITTPGSRRSSRAVVENDLLQSSGELRVFDRRELEQRLGARLKPSLTRLEGQPVFVADRVRVTPRLLAPHRPAPIDQIVSHPGRYLGELVSVEGRVSHLLNGEAIVLDRSLVVLGGGLKADSLRPGDSVRVVGGVRPLDPDQLPGRGVLDEDLYGELTERPAVVAQSIERER